MDVPFYSPEAECMVGSWCGKRGSLWFLGAPVTILKLLSSIS
jgi:hypothetical protein